MFVVSRKFHSSFGIPGTEVSGTYMEVKTAQGRGWEWYGCSPDMTPWTCD